jgi:hypothetical protein
MSDTALNGTEPILDLDAMLEDLHNDFKGDIPIGGGEESGDASTGDDEGTVEPPPELEATETDTSPDSEPLPPGYVQFGQEVLPENEVQALLELNRRVKGDPDTASRVRQAVLGQVSSPEQTAPPSTEEADALPAWLDPDDQQSVFLYRQQQRIDRELAEVRRRDEQRQAQFAQTAEQQRQAEVIDAFRSSMKEFRDEYPGFSPEDLKVITDRAAGMGLLENPEKIGKTLRGGIVKALELAMWDSPEYRAKAEHGATVRTKEQQSKDRKQKSSALSSSTGTSPRTQSQEPAPTNRQEVMAQGLDFLRSGAVTD